MSDSNRLFEQVPAFGEEDCESALFRAKWPDGFRCPRCGGLDFYRIVSRGRRVFECRSCARQTSLTAGTILEGTRTPLVKWFQALCLMQTGISAKLLAELIQVTYKTAWLINHKLRYAIQVHDERRPLSGDLQLLGDFYARPATNRPSDPLKYRDEPAVAGASIDPESGELAEVKIKRLSAATFSRRTFAIDSFGGFLWRHAAEDRSGSRRIDIVKASGREGVTALGSVWRGAIGWLARTFGGIGPKHLQAYLDEYCFRVNVRADGFRTLLALCGRTSTITQPELVRKRYGVRSIRWTGQTQLSQPTRSVCVS
ncbi:Transposase zinc-ribbon domain-containing protein [Cohnella sp. OV330]|uniref:transposase n=1 Tax=Cohnella sp. OV330 TaxID=1855288 RepID=UPI0008EF29EE|nr:transposase [Cohnella sp. OV330]SFA93814.1 Transposase zinc-ribbon domain-containing protein [Cohnella sp. OV330]